MAWQPYQSSQEPGIDLIGFRGLTHVQIPQFALNLIFTYLWEGLHGPSLEASEMWEERLPLKTEAEKIVE